MQSPDAIIVGAGPAGLACAMTMRKVGLAAVVLEKADTVGSAWRRHYDRLCLHSHRRHSGLPGMAMPESYPAYPSRAQIVDYLEAYRRGLISGPPSTRRYRTSGARARNGVRKQGRGRYRRR